MSIQFSEPEMFEFFLSEPERLNEYERIFFYSTKLHENDHTVNLTVKDYQEVVEIGVMTTRNQREVFRVLLTDITRIEVNSERCLFFSGEEEKAYIVGGEDFLVVVN